MDTSPLRGRRIVLDPGHGGVFRGVVGRDGLAEADVNLGVALYLRGLLEWAGAEVCLTRTVDRDFLSPADSSLAADLAARVAVAESCDADVFLSLHHNSNPALDRTRNETQTYYPAGRDGADLDLARAIQARLVRNLGIRPARILPGNFFVLRHSPCPAVLGEPAMLSHPGVEHRLSLAAKQELEARAYFLGLLDYFRAGTPAWSAPVTAATGPGAAAARVVSWQWLPGGRPGRDGPDLDPTSVTLRCGERELSAAVDPARGLVTWRRRGEDLHRLLVVELRGRNVRGRSAPVRRDTLWPVAERFTVQADRDGTGRLCLRWTTGGTPAPLLRSVVLAGGDGRELVLPATRADGGAVLAPPGWTPPPAGTATLRWERADGANGRVAVAVTPGPAFPDSRWVVLAAPAPWPAGSVPGGAWRDRPGLVPGTDPLPAAADRATAAVPLRRGGAAWLEADGVQPLLLSPATPDTVAWTPLVPSLAGRTVLVDAAGGGRDDLGRDAVGRSGADLDLSLARRLAALLRRAGARAVLSRTDDRHLDEPTRVLLAAETGADLMITLTRGPGTGPAWRVRHYPGSTTGMPWARAVATALAAAGLADTVVVSADGGYLLRQVACPVVVVELPRPGRRDGPPAAADSLLAWQQALAGALFTATADRSHEQPVPPARLDSLVAAVSVAGVTDPDWLLWDGNWLWTPPPVTVSWRPALPLHGNRHTVEYRRGGEHGVLVVTREADGTWRAAPVIRPPRDGPGHVAP